MAPRTPANRNLFGDKIKPIPARDKNAEAKRQASIVEYVRWVAVDGTLIWAVPNGGYRDKAEASRLKWTGVLAGVLDLTLVLPDGRCAFWECKIPNGRLSDDQKKMIADLTKLGHTWAVVRDIDDARRELARLGVRTREAGERHAGLVPDRSPARDQLPRQMRTRSSDHHPNAVEGLVRSSQSVER